MATSHAPTDIDAEFYINGAWVNTISGNGFAHRVRGTDDKAAVTITRGTADYQGSVSAQTAAFSLNNRDGLFTDDNPLSPLFGLFGQNTRARLGVKSGGTWQEYLRMPDYRNTASQQYAYTADKATLDITGDIDIRVEFSPAYTRGREMVLASKWNTSGSQRSWMLLTQPDGGFKFWSSADGSATLAKTTTATVIAEETTRVAVRLTLDVDNGAAGRVYTFYTASSISGPWVSFYTATIAGTTSIFASTANLEIGTAGGGGTGFTTSDTFTGKVHGAEVYNGIAGTLVADFKPNGKTVEATTWADTCATPNTWLLSGSYARLASDRIRVAGELLTTPLNWDKTGVDVQVPVALAGMLARYSANKSTLGGCIYRFYRNKTEVTDYWPCEDAAGSAQAASVVTGGAAGKVFDVTFGSTTGMDGTTGSLTLNTALSSFARFQAGHNPGSTGNTTSIFYVRVNALPAAETVVSTSYVTGGTVRQCRFFIGPTTYRFDLIDAGGGVIFSGNSLFGAGASPLNQWIGMSINFAQSGSNYIANAVWHAVGGDVFFNDTFGGSPFAGTAGQFTRNNFVVGDAALAGMQIAHVILTHGANLINSSVLADASRAFTGELYGVRAQRLCSEENVYFQWRGDLNDTQPVGPQPVGTLYDVLVAGLKAAGGILTDIRDILGFELITPRFLGNRRGLVMDYSASHLADVPLPVTDTRYLVNDFTATRDGGSSARYIADDGRRKNVNDPPAGIGRWEKSDSFGAYADDQMPLIASQQVFFGTWEERRIPNLSIHLGRSEIAGSSALLTRVISTDLGDPVNLTGLSASPLPPNDLLTVIYGYTETIAGFQWEIVANTVPAGPYQVPILGDYSGRIPVLDVTDSTHTTLHGGVTSGATSFTAKTRVDTGPGAVTAWVDTTNYPSDIGSGVTIDVDVDGERITVSSITAPASSGALVSGGFESGVTGWAATSATLTQSSTFAFAGTFSALITVTGSPATALLRTTSANCVPVVPGVTYTATAEVRSTATITVAATIDWYTSSLVYISSNGTGSSLTSGAFALRTATGAAPANAAFASYGTTISGSPATGTLLYSDAIDFTTAAYNYQTFTVTRAVNGIAKAHLTDAGVSLFNPFYLGLE